MQIMTGTRREITIRQWDELIEKYAKRLNDSLECYRRFHESDDLRRVIEDSLELAEYSRHAAEVIDTMDAMGIE